MNILAGTSKGVFAIDGSHEPIAVLPERSVRDLARGGRRLLAGADTGIFASDDGGRTWQPSGVQGRTVWDILAGSDAAGEIYAGTAPRPHRRLRADRLLELPGRRGRARHALSHRR